MEKLSQVYLHSAVMIPKGAFTGVHLSHDKLKGVEMWWDYSKNVIIVHYKGQVLLMPTTNVSIAMTEAPTATSDVHLASPIKTVRKSKGESVTI